jgi:hypothetical protein
MKCFFRLALLLLPLGCATLHGDGSWPGSGKHARKTRQMLFEIEHAPFTKLTSSLRGDIRETARALITGNYSKRVGDRRAYIAAAHGFADEIDRQPSRVAATHYGLACLQALQRAAAPDDPPTATVSSDQAVGGGEVHPWLLTPVGLDQPTTVRTCLSGIKGFANRAYAKFPDAHPQNHILDRVKDLALESETPPDWIDDPTLYPVLALRIGRAWQQAYAADEFAQLIATEGQPAEDAAKAAWTACCFDELEPALGGLGGQGGP